jgi:VanZ family protein
VSQDFFCWCFFLIKTRPPTHWFLPWSFFEIKVEVTNHEKTKVEISGWTFPVNWTLRQTFCGKINSFFLSWLLQMNEITLYKYLTAIRIDPNLKLEVLSFCSLYLEYNRSNRDKRHSQFFVDATNKITEALSYLLIGVQLHGYSGQYGTVHLPFVQNGTLFVAQSYCAMISETLQYCTLWHSVIS